MADRRRLIGYEPPDERRPGKKDRRNTETEREAAWAEIEDALRQYDNVDEFVGPQTYLIGVRTK